LLHLELVTVSVTISISLFVFEVGVEFKRDSRPILCPTVTLKVKINFEVIVIVFQF